MRLHLNELPDLYLKIRHDSPLSVVSYVNQIKTDDSPKVTVGHDDEITLWNKNGGLTEVWKMDQWRILEMLDGKHPPGFQLEENSAKTLL
jgi:hypothetical protein